MHTLFNESIVITRVKGYTPNGAPRFEFNPLIVMNAIEKMTVVYKELVLNRDLVKTILKGSSALIMKNGNIRFISYCTKQDLKFIEKRIIENLVKHCHQFDKLSATDSKKHMNSDIVDFTAMITS